MHYWRKVRKHLANALDPDHSVRMAYIDTVYDSGESGEGEEEPEGDDDLAARSASFDQFITCDLPEAGLTEIHVEIHPEGVLFLTVIDCASGKAYVDRSYRLGVE